MGISSGPIMAVSDVDESPTSGRGTLGETITANFSSHGFCLSQINMRHGASGLVTERAV